MCKISYELDSFYLVFVNFIKFWYCLVSVIILFATLKEHTGEKQIEYSLRQW